jgi:intracellular septation protein
MNPQLRRLALDLGPLILFFAAFQYAGIFAATGIFMVAVLTSLTLGWHLEKKLSPIPLVTAILVVIFGGLTLYLHNDTFIKVKLTVLYVIFGTTLLVGLRFNRIFIKYVFAEAFDLTEKGWRGLTWRWGLFFLSLAALNEAVWRNTSTATWVSFKVWGIMSLIFLFALAQAPFLLKHHADPEQ